MAASPVRLVVKAMSHERSDVPTGTELASVPAPLLDDFRARLRVLRQFRADQLALLVALLAVVAAVAVAPATLTAFLGLFAATVALLAVVPYVVVRTISDGR